MLTGTNSRDTNIDEESVEFLLGPFSEQYPEMLPEVNEMIFDYLIPYLPYRAVSRSFLRTIDTNSYFHSLLNSDVFQADIQQLVLTKQDAINLCHSQQHEIDFLLANRDGILEKTGNNEQIAYCLDQLKSLSQNESYFNLCMRHKILNKINESIILTCTLLNEDYIGDSKPGHDILDCSGLFLTRFPTAILDIARHQSHFDFQIKILNLSNNQLTHLPCNIQKLKELYSCNISNNQICQLPMSITTLSKVCSFNARNNHLTDLPNNLKEMKNLYILDICDNCLTEIPEDLGDVALFDTVSFPEITEISREDVLANQKELSKKSNSVSLS